MKKVLAAFLVIATLFTFTACGSDDNSGTDTGEESTEITGSGQTDPDEDGNYTTATVTLKDGVFTSVTVDAYYAPKDAFKKELKEDYGMTGIAPKGEWYVQAEYFENWCIGKTPEEVANIETETNSEGNEVPKSGTDLAEGCTISVTDFQKAVALAVEAAK